MPSQKNTLIVLLGPTGVGKTALSIHLANRFGSPIVSCDSRQFYREMSIGTAKPTPNELSLAEHHFVGHISVTDRYSCGMFELDALNKIEEIFSTNQIALMVGGSMLYIDAVCKGIDDFPTPDPALRKELHALLENEGIEGLRAQLKLLDPDYYSKVDLKNPQRILKGVEVSLQTGKPYSSFLKQKAKQRNFEIVTIGLNQPREELYERINQRVDEMVANGLVDEVRSLLPYRNLVALKTVGYTEIFEFLDGKISLEKAIELIKRNSRHYAKRQITWWQRDASINWFHPENVKEVEQFIEEQIQQSTV
jgi:tRNA dimethylallyltransferase